VGYRSPYHPLPRRSAGDEPCAPPEAVTRTRADSTVGVTGPSRTQADRYEALRVIRNHIAGSRLRRSRAQRSASSYRTQAGNTPGRSRLGSPPSLGVSKAGPETSTRTVSSVSVNAIRSSPCGLRRGSEERPTTSASRRATRCLVSASTDASASSALFSESRSFLGAGSTSNCARTGARRSVARRSLLLTLLTTVYPRRRPRQRTRRGEGSQTRNRFRRRPPGGSRSQS
jgi:hypothetical protein